MVFATFHDLATDIGEHLSEEHRRSASEEGSEGPSPIVAPQSQHSRHYRLLLKERMGTSVDTHLAVDGDPNEPIGHTSPALPERGVFSTALAIVPLSPAIIDREPQEFFSRSDIFDSTMIAWTKNRTSPEESFLISESGHAKRLCSTSRRAPENRSEAKIPYRRSSRKYLGG